MSDPQPAGASPTGFGALAQGLGLSSNYNAKAANADYGGAGYGPGGQLGLEAGQLAAKYAPQASDNPFAMVNSQRVDNDYAQAGQQVQSGFGKDYGMNLARGLVQQGTDASIAAQMAASKSGNPAQSGVAAYQAAQSAADMQQKGSQQAATLGSQLQGNYDQADLQARLANRSMNLQQLGLSQQNMQSQIGMNLQSAGMNQDLYKYLLGLQQGYAGQQQQGQEAYANLASGNYNQAQNINAGVAAGSAGAGAGLMNGVVGAAGGVATGGMSLAAAQAAKQGGNGGY